MRQRRGSRALQRRALGEKPEGSSIDAVTLACGRGAIGKYVAQMRACASTQDLNAQHARRGVAALKDVVGIKGFEKAWPTRAALKLVLRGEERQPTDGTHPCACSAGRNKS